MRGFHAYSQGNERRVVRESSGDDSSFRVRIAGAEDVRIVTGPGRYTSAPQDTPCLALAANTMIDAAFTVETGDGAEVTLAYVVILLDGAVENMLPMELTRDGAGSMRASLTTRDLILARPGFFRLMIYARGDGEITIRDLSISFITLEAPN
jgi:hypothetical protein